MYDLAVAPPHLPPRARFDPVSYTVYCQGYAMGLSMALQVMDFAGERFKMHARTRRIEARRRRHEKG